MIRQVTSIAVEETVPCVESIFVAQGVPANAVTRNRVGNLVSQSIERYRELAQPIGILAGIKVTEFEVIYESEGLNAESTPLEDIFRSAETLCLFAVTIGADISHEITRLFEARDFAAGSMLDSAASEGAENSAQWLEDHYVEHLRSAGMLKATTGVLRFSPGYCGWHVSAQGKLFSYLRPGEIGITLTDSFLMQPLKSISGVIISGKKEIFEFDDTFPFCSECIDHACVERIRTAARK